MITDKEFCEEIHNKIHIFRRVPNYKASLMDQEISKLVIDKYSDTCKDCKERGDKIKANPVTKKGLFQNIKDAVGTTQ